MTISLLVSSDRIIWQHSRHQATHFLPPVSLPQVRFLCLTPPDGCHRVMRTYWQMTHWASWQTEHNWALLHCTHSTDCTVHCTLVIMGRKFPAWLPVARGCPCQRNLIIWLNESITRMLNVSTLGALTALSLTHTQHSVAHVTVVMRWWPSSHFQQLYDNTELSYLIMISQLNIYRGEW